MHEKRRYMRFLATAALVATSITAPTGVAQAADTPDPTTVTIAGSLQSEVGCPGDWDPTCATTDLSADATDGVWQGTFDLPAGSFQYKAALNGSWAESYGARATLNGANIGLSLAEPTSVKFFYDHETHWVTDNVGSAIATAAGDFQSELGCSGDWDPSCLRSWLQDQDTDGTYTFTTDALPVGAYQFKVARDETWDVSYGAGGGAENLAFTVAGVRDRVTIIYSPVDNVPTVTVQGQGMADTEPPVVSAALVPLQVGTKQRKLQVDVDCTDNITQNCLTEADINGVPVEDGDVVQLVVNPGRQKVERPKGTSVIRIKAPSFTMTATCTDEAGNSATVTVTPRFGGHGGPPNMRPPHD